MKLLKNKGIFFKIIISIILCFIMTNGILWKSVDAVCNDEHTKEKSGSPTTNIDGTDAAGNVMKTVTHTYTDGCIKIEKYVDGGYTIQNVKVTWKYKDGTTSESNTTTANDAGQQFQQNQSSENLKHSEASQGGKLLQPVVDLLLTLGDGIMDGIQRAVIGIDGHISLDIAGKGLLATILGVLAGILVIVAISVVTGGIGAFVAGLGGAVGTLLTAVGSTGIVSMVITAATVAGAVLAGVTVADGVKGAFLPDITVLPTYSVSPEEIFEGKLLLFDINFFKPKEVKVKYKDNSEVDYYYYMDGNNEVITSKQNTSLQLSKIISKWYYAIRNIALVVMMIILVYIGIRMMTSSIASEKSKYKKMLGDWVVSMCLVFVLHYIMVFAVSINENIIDIVEAAADENQSIEIIDLQNMDRKKEFIEAVYKTTGGEANEYFLDSSGKCIYSKEEAKSKDPTKDESKIAGFAWPTNLVGRMRIFCQYQNGSSEYVGYAVAYLVLVFYTVFFAFTYLKRVLYMAFLTIIAPFVAMTYSIDKIADGKAQAFNMWLKEYIFNLLIQPMHLMLYMILISSAYELSSTNIIYTLVAIGFMIPAEKFVRKMFGFEKAQTPGMLGGAAGAALTMGGMQKLAHLAGHGPNKGAKPVGKLDKSNSENTSKIRTADSGRGINALIGDIGNEGNEDSGVNSNLNVNVPTSNGALSTDRSLSSFGYGGTSAADANSNFKLKDPDDPVAKMEKEALEEKLADGQLTPDELTDSQKAMLGMSKEDPVSRMEREALEEKIADGQITPDELTESQMAMLGMNHNNYQQNNEPTLNEQETGENLNASLEEYQRRKEQYDEKEQKALNKTKREKIKAAASRGKENLKRAANKGLDTGISKENIGKAVSNSIKTGTKAIGVVAGAATGAALGIASGDIGKVGQNAAIGATAGGSIGSAVGNSMTTGTSGMVDRYKNAKTEYEKEKYGEEYSQKQREKQDKEFVKDKETRKFYAQQCSKELANLNAKQREEKLNEIMQDALEYRREGVTDNSIIVKARKLDKNGNTTARESKLAAVMATKSKDNLDRMKYYQDKVTKQIGGDKAIKINQNAAKLAGF